jgi:hypothetical protein
MARLSSKQDGDKFFPSYSVVDVTNYTGHSVHRIRLYQFFYGLHKKDVTAWTTAWQVSGSIWK